MHRKEQDLVTDAQRVPPPRTIGPCGSVEKLIHQLLNAANLTIRSLKTYLISPQKLTPDFDYPKGSTRSMKESGANTGDAHRQGDVNWRNDIRADGSSVSSLKDGVYGGKRYPQ